MENYSYFKNLYLKSYIVVIIICIISLTYSENAWSQLTETPGIQLGTPCKADVTYDWNNLQTGNRVDWELSRGTIVLDSGNQTFNTGKSITLDLRVYGSVQNSTVYSFRIREKQGNQILSDWSDPVLFDVDFSPDGTFTATLSSQDPYQINLDWSGLQSDIVNCSSHIFYEVKQGNDFTNMTGDEPQALLTGLVPIDQNVQVIDLTGLGSGDHFIRLVGKFDGDGDSVYEDVGRRGTGIMLTVGDQAPSLTIKVFHQNSLNPDTKQADWIKDATVAVVNHPQSQTTPVYNNSINTDDNGEAVFSGVAPNGVYNVTVSKTGCGDPVTKTSVIPNNIFPVHLRDLDCGKIYATPLYPVAPDRPGVFSLRITDFQLNNGADEVMATEDIALNFSHAGRVIPTHYKVEECSAFYAHFIKWKELPAEGTPVFKVPAPRNSKICFQLRGSLALPVPGNLEILSNVASDKIKVTPFDPNLGPITISGSEVVDVVEFAQAQGFIFTARTLTDNPLIPCKNLGALIWGDLPCEARFFSRSAPRLLNSPWRISSVGFSQPVVFLSPIGGFSSPTNDPSFRIMITQYTDIWTVLLNSITFIGPEGGDWRDAFIRE